MFDDNASVNTIVLKWFTRGSWQYYRSAYKYSTLTITYSYNIRKWCYRSPPKRCHLRRQNIT